MNRAERRARTARVVAARVRIWHQFTHFTAASRKKWAGIFRKRHPLDCGNTKCGLCHREPRHGVGPRHLPPLED